MNERACENANQTAKSPWKYPKIVKIKTIGNLVYKYKPDEKKDNGWWYKAQYEPFVFNVGFFWQEKKVTSDE